MYNPLAYTAEFEAVSAALRQGPAAVSGLTDPAKALLVGALPADRCPWRLVIVRDEQQGKRFQRDLRSLAENTWYYPAKDLLFYQADTQGTLLTRQRMEVLRHLLEDSCGTIVTTIDALMDRISGRESIQEARLRIVPGAMMEMSALATKLQRLGYERVAEVEAMGEFSIRGGIVDIFPFDMENPVRVEFWDTEVDNLRVFDVESQRSLGNLEAAEIFPARENLSGTREASLLDYFPENSLFVLDEPDRLQERGLAVEKEFSESLAARLEGSSAHAASKAPADDSAEEQLQPIYTVETVLARLTERHFLALSSLGSNLQCVAAALQNRQTIAVETAAVSAYKNSLELLLSDLRQWQKEKYEVILLTVSRTRASRLAQELRDYELHAYCPDEGEKEQAENRGAIKVLNGYLHTGFLFPEEKLAVLTEADMFGNAGEVRKKRKQKKYEGQQIRKLEELSIGDYVVHESHGIGIYRGIERIESDGISKDYMKVEYADGGNLYLPATKLEGLQKYADAEAKKPKLNKLGDSEWRKTRTRVQHAVKEMAKELVQLYARRQQAEGYRFSPDTVWQREFEELFPYEETADQVLAIDAAKSDMESRKIMDRLICGDVGYGKTEVALRAAFKAVQDSKQVAYLVPTTILAQQIYNTFVERMKGFPVNVALLCRFRTPQQIKKSLADLAAGRADIVIGTHRLLSKDVKYKDLGLLIVDEEQRFGVTHKERIKSLKQNVDVLTLTATPIPRTLHMSLVGIRDMSVLEEPPIDRIPVQTYVMEYNEELVREAISRELSRGGQVYFVHNRVNNIAETAAQVQALAPEARVAYAHGQMSETQLEDIMLQFINGEIDVLVSTTIIETGLDIPNANTLIIDAADRMGLSQLYQLRGRVGRSNRTAYAFLMYRRGKLLTEESEKRLKAIREFTQLGSGIRIAMRDLEIRGAGNVLGAEQHGHMEAVGYELYCKLLNMAVRQEKGELTEADSFDTQVECAIDAFIPDSYISNEGQKLDAYKRISSIESREDYMDMQDELTDRFGEPPREVQNLLTIAWLKALAHRCSATELNVGRGSYRVLFRQKAVLRAERIPALVQEANGQLRFSGGATPMLVYRQRPSESRWTMEETLQQVEKLLTELMPGAD